MLLCADPASADGWRPYLRTEAMAYSEPVPIEPALDDWEGRYASGGEHQWAHLWVEAGARNDRWSLGALYRRELDLRFSEDTAELYYYIRNDLDLPTERQYRLALTGYHFELAGARVSRHFQLRPGLSATVGASLFTAWGLQYGRLEGTAVARSEREYAYQGEVDYQYERDRLFDRDSDKPTGFGASLDLAVHWREPGVFAVDLAVIDALGMIRWRDVPYTEATVNSEQVGVDDDGFVKVEPVLTGYEGYRSRFDQRLKTRTQLSAAAAVADGVWADAELMCRPHQCLYGIGGSVAGVRLLYWPQFDGVGLRVRWGRLVVDFSADALKLNQAHAMFLSIGYDLP